MATVTQSGGEDSTQDSMERLVAAALQAIVKAGATRHVVAATASALLRSAHDILADGCRDEEVENRMKLQQTAIQAHNDLTAMTGQARHNLGLATLNANDHLTAKGKCALKSLRKKANRARHVWEVQKSNIPEPASDENDSHTASTTGTEVHGSVTMSTQRPLARTLAWHM